MEISFALMRTKLNWVFGPIGPVKVRKMVGNTRERLGQHFRRAPISVLRTFVLCQRSFRLKQALFLLSTDFLTWHVHIQIVKSIYMAPGIDLSNAWYAAGG